YIAVKCLLKLCNLRAGGDPVGTQHLYHSFDVFLVNPLMTIRQHPLADWMAAMERRDFFLCQAHSTRLRNSSTESQCVFVSLPYRNPLGSGLADFQFCSPHHGCFG